MTSDDSPLFAVDATTLDRIVQRVIEPGRFFVARGFALRTEVVRGQRELWEVFNGQLLGEGQTREHAKFDSWRLYLDRTDRRAEQPLIEIKWNNDERRLYVTRSLLVRGWETYEPSPNVIESRQANVWTRELVGWMDGAQATDEDSFFRELAVYVRAALAGTSRLAITSLENPLPDFALGHVAYVAAAEAIGDTPLDDPRLLVASMPTGPQDSAVAAGMLETALRAAEPAMIPDIANTLAQLLAEHANSPAVFTRILRTLFNQVSLSPYTRLTDNLVELVSRVAKSKVIGVEASVDSISYTLRHLVRHLTAFNLTTFHNQGANYPDALFLDRLLGAYIEIILQEPALFRGRESRLRRRALRQAYLVRRSLEGV
ncbi:MAG: hypothetical protein MI757_07845, partial [Pirellulales bacterium]|nr:hypothetical protein [Pirellulales bacterium]